MFELWPSIRCPAILGRSTQNIRIERLWRETNRTATQRFRSLLKHLEEPSVIDPDGPGWEFQAILTLIFLPIIQRALDLFRQSWDYHLASEKSQAPIRLRNDGWWLRNMTPTLLSALTVDPDGADDESNIE